MKVSTDTNIIYNNNCLDVLCDIDDQSVDLTILDPQYNDWDKLCEDGLLCQAVRVTKNTGNIILFTKQPFDFNLRNEIDHIFRREIIWTFCNGGAWVSNKMPLVSFQKIYWCVLSKDFYFNPRTGIAYSDTTRNFKRTTKDFEGYHGQGHEFVKSGDGIWLRDHLHYNKPNCGAIPAKPQELIDTIVRCFCPDGGLVLDPFAGTGTTALAAIRQGKKFICIEIVPDRVSNIQKAIEMEIKGKIQQNSQLSIFE